MGIIEGFDSGRLADQWFNYYSQRLLNQGYLLTPGDAGKGLQHRVLAMVSQHSGRRPNGFPPNQVNWVLLTDELMLAIDNVY